MARSAVCEGSKSTAISGFCCGPKKARPASWPKFGGMITATVALPLRTAARASSGLEGFTSSAFSPDNRLTMSREIALRSWSTAKTGILLWFA